MSSGLCGGPERSAIIAARMVTTVETREHHRLLRWGGLAAWLRGGGPGGWAGGGPADLAADLDGDAGKARGLAPRVAPLRRRLPGDGGRPGAAAKKRAGAARVPGGVRDLHRRHSLQRLRGDAPRAGGHAARLAALPKGGPRLGRRPDRPPRDRDRHPLVAAAGVPADAALSRLPDPGL